MNFGGKYSTKKYNYIEQHELYLRTKKCIKYYYINLHKMTNFWKHNHKGGHSNKRKTNDKIKSNSSTML